MEDQSQIHISNLMQIDDSNTDLRDNLEIFKEAFQRLNSNMTANR